mmetsp:Transcript_13864/g.24863  ORF Transcript_13864/g.24863 Transcript_13864/m.24863 type:complete len:144 (-) Transcript_13864:561-992(-)
MILTNCEGPMVVVLSGSMEPGIHKGDVMLLYNSNSQFSIGEIVVYKIPGREIPIIHRVHKVYQIESDSSLDFDQFLMTKGDNNFSDDISLYNGRQFLTKELIFGRALARIPYIGWATIILNEYPLLKYTIIGALTLSTLFFST